MAEQGHTNPRRYAGLSWPQWTAVILVIGGLGALADILGWLNIGPNNKQTPLSPVATTIPRAASTSTTTGLETTLTTEDTSTTTQTSSGDSVGAATYLNELQPTDQSHGNVALRRVTIDGDPYPRSIVMHHSTGFEHQAYATYAIARQYRRFKAVVGIVDSSPSKTMARLEIYVDGRKEFSKIFQKGQPYPVSLDVEGAYELKLMATEVGEGPTFGEAVGLFQSAFGDAHVLA